jgi:cellulose synthase/poly-beta-1,6-N-acetylglucosamine synthase-like glycosyltransferase
MKTFGLCGVLVLLAYGVAAVLAPTDLRMTAVCLIKWSAWLIGFALIGITTAEALELIDLLRHHTTHKRRPVSHTNTKPFVSFHVPICAEPPEVVTRTLIALRDLKYDTYEVIVVDNNTKEEQLWRPIEALCRDIGPRFRFHHLPHWPGFKAGALNFALQRTSPEATVIGVIDSDCEVAPNYLSEVVSYFSDERVGFVQTPQNYRHWAGSRYSRMCYWEYWQFFAVGMVLRAPRNAILMHGTMCLVRKEALIRVGGWAEWCLTEDSELGLRILAAGFRGIYIFRTFGYGLMPFSYQAYKRQRRRWVTGGVQTLMRHWRFFIPWRFRGSGLSTMQKLHYLQGWLPWFRDGVLVSLVPVIAALSFAVLTGSAALDLLSPLCVGVGSVVLHVVGRQVIVYRIYLSRRWAETLGATVAILGLTWTIGTAWLLGWLGGKRVFHRTPKRPAAKKSWVAGACAELIVGVVMFFLGIALLDGFGVRGLGTASALWAYAMLFLSAVWSSFIASGSLRESEETGRPNEVGEIHDTP